MYKNNFVVCIKANGKILREKEGLVALPFGSEYSMYLRNLESRRAMVQVSIDGDTTSGSRWLVMGPNAGLELERFIRNDNLEQGNRFKFIERTSEVEAGRGVEAEDGLVRVEVKKEKQFPVYVPCSTWYYNSLYPSWWYPSWPSNDWYSGTGKILRSSNFVDGLQNSGTISANCCNSTQSNKQTAERNDAGITVPGSVSNQGFVDVAGFPTESETDVIVLRLVGHVGKQEVSRPVTVDLNATCQTCKKVNKATSNFCSRCGTSLQII